MGWGREEGVGARKRRKGEGEVGWGGVGRRGGSVRKGVERGRGGVGWEGRKMEKGRGEDGERRERRGGEGRGELSDVVSCCLVQYTLQIPSYKPCAFSLLHPCQLWSEREPSLQPQEQLGEGRGWEEMGGEGRGGGGEGRGGKGRWQCQRKEKGK